MALAVAGELVPAGPTTVAVIVVFPPSEGVAGVRTVTVGTRLDTPSVTTFDEAGL